jgi:small GTP-binding protein
MTITLDKRLLATHSWNVFDPERENVVFIWSLSGKSAIAAFFARSPYTDFAPIAFSPDDSALATLAADPRNVLLWDIDTATLVGSAPKTELVSFVSAKVVLVGESNVGKSCLATRLVENRYPTDKELGSTLGMRFLQVKPEALDRSAAAPEGQKRELVIWDLGGQDEYRLIHQLFLHDTTLALVLIDPTRGRAAFEEAEDWNKRLEKQLSGRKATKLLVGAKVDRPIKGSVVDKAAIKALCQRCGFDGYHETSAKTGRGVPALRKAIARALDWDAQAAVLRPEVRQRVRDEVTRLRDAGEVAVSLDDLKTAVPGAGHDEVCGLDPVAVVAAQLAAEGMVALTRLASGVRMLVLRIEQVERYAGSLILAAKQGHAGVPALEERTLGSASPALPGFSPKDRLPRLQELTVLECVAELLIEHGVGFRHGGLLIFPTLFPPPPTIQGEKLPHSVSLYYDFSGAIDNIYASLVSFLVIGGDFGKGRLWPGRVEFDAPGQGVCGIRQVCRARGFAHLDLYFDEATAKKRREFFVRFVEDHLARHGVTISEHQAVVCRGCGYEVSEELVRIRIDRSEGDVICPACGVKTLISEGVATIRGRLGEDDQGIIALRTEIERKAAKEADELKRIVTETAKAATADAPAGPIRILHLSDLHFTAATKPETLLEWLVADVVRGKFLKDFTGFEYLVLSGDVTDKGNDAGFEKAREFVTLVIKRFGLSALRCVFVPGNHDVQDVKGAHDWYPSKDDAKKVVADEKEWHSEGSVIFLPSKDYPLRFKAFSDAYFHKIVPMPYPLEPEKQGLCSTFPDTRVQFLALNSCWQIDRFHRKRSAVHPDALALALREAERQREVAIADSALRKGDRLLRIAVWHHAAAGPEMMQNVDFLGHLRDAGVKLGLHGDVHELRRELVGYWHPRPLHIVGAGSFGSPAEGRPESTPRLYNVIELARDLSSARVHTRQQPKPNGTWEGWNAWPPPDGGPGGVPYFDIDLS